MVQERTAQKHEFEPIFDEKSRILILGTFPSVKSRESHFYYGHPQNRFWKVIAKIVSYPVPETIQEKKKMLLDNHIAIWDVIASCEIAGSSDSSIRNVVPADIPWLLANSQIQTIYANGSMAKKLYEKYIKPDIEVDIIGLPSTSPANAVWSLPRLVEEWGRLIEFNR